MKNTLIQAQPENQRKDISLKEIIISLVKAMQADYGHSFKSVFHEDEALRDFKNRMLEKLKGFSNEQIISGYGKAAELSPKFPPSVIEILAQVILIQKEDRRKEKNRLEAERVGYLPKPKITCNPIEMLREAILKIEADEAGLTKAEKWTKHLERLKDHEFLIYEHEQKFKTVPADHICEASFCGNPGSISHSTSGGGNYYCQEHYRRAG